MSMDNSSPTKLSLLLEVVYQCLPQEEKERMMEVALTLLEDQLAPPEQFSPGDTLVELE